jgi:hypothetical protein
MTENRDDTERADRDVPSADPPSYGTTDRTWLSPDPDDPERDEAAERAAEAVEPGRERE